MKFNSRGLYPLVDDKVLCKERLQEQGLAVPDLISVASSMRQTSHIDDLLGGKNAHNEAEGESQDRTP